jgi:hypothetical protein
VPLAIFLFLLLWTTFWTIGGYAAMTAFLRSLAGKDRVRLIPAGFELMRCAGPFRRTRVIDRADIRRIRMRLHDNALVADATFGTVLLTDLGTGPERETICRWLRGGLQLPPEGEAPIDIDKAPPGWRMQTAEDGSIRLRRKSAWLPRASRRVARPARVPEIPSSGGPLDLGVSLRSRAVCDRKDHGQRRRRPLPPHSALAARRAHDQSAINDDGEIVECARWLAARTGFALESRR